MLVSTFITSFVRIVSKRRDGGAADQPCKCRGSKKAKFLEKKLFIRVLTFDVNTTFPIQRNGRKGHPIPSGSLAAQSCPLLDRDHPSLGRIPLERRAAATGSSGLFASISNLA